MKKNLLFQTITILLLYLSVLTPPLSAQRKMEKLDRGVVAVRNSAGTFFVSWRFFATDAENTQFNLYAKKSGAAGFSKLNNTPLTQTNYTPSAGSVLTGTQLYVTPVINGVEGTPSGIFTVPGTGFTSYRSAYLDITYNPAIDNLDISKYSTKFCWPADLDGDGEYDFVVDRLSTDGLNSHKIQAYLRNGTLLWTVDMGPNVSICQGQDDMVIAYDMDGDGKADVVIKSSDGTIFADGKGVNGSTTLDTDNDGIINYETQTVKNAPQYITVIDGLTGKEKNSIEMKYPSNYTRTNKANFMGEGYYNLNGHMAIEYLDGKHPSVGFIYKTRELSQYHFYYASAWGYNQAGQWVNQYNWERGYQDCAEGHGIRVADVDLDGRDELLDIGYGIKYDGTLAFNAHITHGDRFRVGDIDPDRPGLETFAIQQNAMLGMLLYDSSTGTSITKKYLSAVGDVGRGECMDVDSTHLGYEFYSTMANIYDAKGNTIYEGATPFPNEGVWWDGDLAREELTSADGNGFNADIRKYDINTHDFGNRLIEFAKMTGWQVKSEWGRRPAFFGDIAGDWREEVVLEKSGVASDGVTATCPGIVAFSTDYPTTKRIYCLMQNPAYRMQATTKGYYESAFPDFYLGYNMPTPPVSAVQKAKLTWTSGTSFDKSSKSFVLEDEKSTAAFADGDDVMFDISGNNSATIQLPADLAPSKLWAMNPKGKDYVLSGAGKLTGTMELVKSMNGTFTLNGNHAYTGKTTISEGILAVNGSLASPIEIRAKGSLAGNTIINGGITFDKALNIEGSRLMPGNGLAADKLGKMTVNGNLNLNGKTNVEFDLIPSAAYKNDSLVVNGNLAVSGINNIVIKTQNGTLPSGSFSLIKWSGTFTGTVDNFSIEGISGLPMSLVIENNTLKLVVNAVRTAADVTWKGTISSDWDYLSENFTLNNAPTYFVNNDNVLFTDTATLKTVNLTDNLTTSKTTFTNVSSAYVLKGAGGIIGTGDLVKTGKGLLDIQTVKNGYTGKTLLTNATVQVAALSDAGTVGSLGSAAVDPANMVLTNSRLIVNAVSTNTNRGYTLVGNDTINIPKSNGVVTLTGLITGTGKLVKNGAGQLNISGSVANTYTGGTIISGGNVGLSTLLMNTSAFGSGPITLESGGKISMYYNTGDYNQKPTWNISIAQGQTGSLLASGRCVISGSISGAGTLNYTVPYVRADLVAGGANFTGKLVVINGGSGSFRITANTIGFPLANIHLSNVVDMGAYATTGASGTSASTTVKIGSLSGIAGSTVGAGIWQIGSDNRDATFAGIFNAGATVIKSGTGTWTLTGASVMTSAFTVSGGKVIINNTTGSPTGTGTVYVNNTGTLAGNGVVTGAVVINSGATL
ncbi:MAG TPA: autotransporter-associated beta strand repeat-containing protein, partial [Paludibacter sp.]